MDTLIGGIPIPKFYKFSICTPPQPGQPQDHKAIHHTVVWLTNSDILGMNGETVTTLSPCLTKEQHRLCMSVLLVSMCVTGIVLCIQ